MALPVPRAPGFQSMMKEGSRFYRGLDEAVMRNIEASGELCETLRASYGPKGLSKMVVNHLDKLFITSDASTIMRELQIQHPVAKILMMAAQRQEQEVGDGTNFVMQLAGNLLTKAADLIRMGLKPTEIIDGYELAASRVLGEFLPQNKLDEIKDIRNINDIKPALKTAIATKQYGHEEFLADLVAQACLAILPKSQASGDLPEEQDISFNVDNIRVCKILGGGVQQSHIINGMVFKKHVEGAFGSVKNAKVAVFNCPIDVAATETKATVLIKNADDLVNFSQGEEELLEQQIKAIADAGCNVIVSGAKFGPLGLHYVDKYKMTAVRLQSKFELRRVCRAVGATALLKLRGPTQDEMGRCDEITIDEIGGTPVVVFKMAEKKSKIATVIVRGSTENIMDDVERAIDDGVNVFKMLTRDARLVAGAGATELDLDRQVSQFGRTLPGLEQYAVEKFAEALRAIAVTIGENAGIKTSEAEAVLTAAHGNGNKYAAIDIEQDTPSVLDAKKAQYVDLYAAKEWGIKFATNAACTVLSINCIIVAKQAGGPKPPQNRGAAWDDQD